MHLHVVHAAAAAAACCCCPCCRVMKNKNARKKVKVTFLICATPPIQYAEDMKTADDVLAMLHSSVRVKTQDNETEVPEKIASDRPDLKSISKLEEFVMSRVCDGKAEGNDKMAKAMNATVKTSYASIVSSIAANQNNHQERPSIHRMQSKPVE